MNDKRLDFFGNPTPVDNGVVACVLESSFTPSKLRFCAPQSPRPCFTGACFRRSLLQFPNRWWMLGIFFVALMNSFPLDAQSVSINMGERGGFTTRLIAVLGGITILSLAPSILVMMTSFTRMIVVFAFLRNAMGLQQSPPNVVIISFSLFLTAFVMGPTFEKSYEEGIKPYLEEKITEEVAFDKTVNPVKEFMARNTRDKDLDFITNLLPHGKLTSSQDIPLKTLIPAFMLSEIKKAFEIGFLLFLPFVIIDMVVASVVMALGMMMLPPMMIALPIKLIFFILIDGWNLVVSSLVQGFR